MRMLLLVLACGTPLEPADTGADSVSDTGGPDTDTDTSPDTGPIDTDGDGDFLFADRTLDFDLTLDDAAVAALAVAPEEYVLGTFSFNGESLQAGVRLKGSRSFRDLTKKASFKIDFAEYDAEQRFYGFKRLTLNNMIQDATMSSEHVSYYLHGLLDHPAPRHGYARVTVNGEWFGLYGIVEAVDDDFLERHWPDDDEGNLYEGGYGGDFQEGCASLFEQKEGADTSLSDLQGVIDAVEASTPDTFADVLATYFDPDALLDVWAVELASSNADAYTTLGNNYLLYHAPTDDRWTMVPWGPDQAFTGDEGLYDGLAGALAERCLESTACKARLDARVANLLFVWEQSELDGWVASETARIESDCRADPRSEWGDYGCRDALAGLRAWVAARPDIVRSQILRR